METIHHVHGYDVAQCFFKAVLHREKALLEYRPRYSNLETIQIAVQSYLDRGLIHTGR